MKYPPLKRQLINLSKTTLFFTLVFYLVSYGIASLGYLFDYYLNLSPLVGFALILSMFFSYIFSSISLSRSRAARYVTFPFGLASFSLKSMFYVFVSEQTFQNDTMIFIVSTIFVVSTISLDIIMLVRAYRADEVKMTEELLEYNELLDDERLKTYLDSTKYFFRFLLMVLVFVVLGELNHFAYLTTVYLFFLGGAFLMIIQAGKKLDFDDDQSMKAILIATLFLLVGYGIRVLNINYLSHLIPVTLIHIMVFFPIFKILYSRQDKIARHYDKVELLKK